VRASISRVLPQAGEFSEKHSRRWSPSGDDAAVSDAGVTVRLLRGWRNLVDLVCARCQQVRGLDGPRVKFRFCEQRSCKLAGSTDQGRVKIDLAGHEPGSILGPEQVGRLTPPSAHLKRSGDRAAEQKIFANGKLKRRPVAREGGRVSCDASRPSAADRIGEPPSMNP
jgi:hypothetical protein